MKATVHKKFSILLATVAALVVAVSLSGTAWAVTCGGAGGTFVAKSDVPFESPTLPSMWQGWCDLSSESYDDWRIVGAAPSNFQGHRVTTVFYVGINPAGNLANFDDPTRTYEEDSLPQWITICQRSISDYQGCLNNACQSYGYDNSISTHQCD